MKKTLAILLALALVFSSVTVAFAEETLPADAKTVTTLGMLTGAGNGVTLDYLKTAPQRIQAALMVLRLKGLDDEALAFTGTDNFADADKAAWAKPIMAYLKAHPEVGFAGVGNNNFDPTKEIDAQSYYKVMLETLGYKVNTTEVIGDFVWSNVFEFAASKGLSKVANVLSYTVNDLATATVETLKANVKGSTTKTLGYSLVESKILTVEKAVAAGIYTVPAVALAVESVTAVNNKEIKVVFNKEMDSTSAKTAANYELKDQGTTIVALEDEDFSLSDDKKTVTITVNKNLTAGVVAALTNSTNAKLTVKKDMLAADKVIKLAADYVNSTVKIFDGMIPEVTKVEAVGLKTVKLTMSEPVWDGTDLTLTTGDFAVKSAGYTYFVNSAVASGNTITLGLGTDLIAGEVTVSINAAGATATAVRDFNGIKAFKGDVKFTYAKDTTAAVATVKEATQTAVTLAFSKPVSGSNVTLFHSVKGVANYGVTVTTVTAADEVTFTFGDAKKLPSGTVTLFLVNSTTTGENLKDGYGNLVADATVTASIVIDTVGPKVSETKLNTNASYDITFDENIDVNEAAKAANFSLKKVSDGKDVAFTVAPLNVVNGATKVVRITPASALTDNTSYEVVVKAMKDVPGNAMAATASYTFLVGDNTNPTVVVASTFAVNADGKIYITFSEPMNEAQMLDKTNYLVDVDGTAVDLNADGDVLDAGERGIAIAALGTDDTVTKVSEKSVVIDMVAAVDLPNVQFATLTDLAGKKLVSNTTIGYTLSAIGQETVNVASATLIAKNKVKLTFNKELGNFDNTEFTLVNGADNSVFTAGNELLVSQVESMTVNADGVTEVVLVLAKNINTNATYTDVTAKTVAVLTAAAPVNTKSKTGTKLAGGEADVVADKVAAEVELFTNPDSTKVADVTIADGTAPDKVISINFSEAMKFESMSTLSFSVAGYTVKSVALKTGDSSTVELTVTPGSSAVAKPAVTQNYNIQDAAGNIFAAGTTWTVR